MRVFSKIVMWLLIIVAILVIIAYLLPRQYRVERSIEIAASRSLVYELTCNVDNWHLWTPWNTSMDSTALFERSGNDCEEGTVWRWEGEFLGKGQLTIIKVVPEKELEYQLLFDDGAYESMGGMSYESIGEDSVLVIWYDEGDLGFNPYYRYLGLFMDQSMGPQFEQGLKKLKLVAEEREGWPPIEEKMTETQLALVIRDSAKPATYGEIMGKGFGELYQFIKMKRLEPVGHPFAVYHSWDSVSGESVFDLGMAVTYAADGKGRIKLQEFPGQKVVVADYYGPYEKTASVYKALDKYVEQEGLTVNGNPWEIYITDPMAEPDTSKWHTQIVFPIK